MKRIDVTAFLIPFRISFGPELFQIQSVKQKAIESSSNDEDGICGVYLGRTCLRKDESF